MSIKTFFCLLFGGHVSPSKALASGRKPVPGTDTVDIWDVFKCPRCGYIYELHLFMDRADLESDES